MRRTRRHRAGRRGHAAPEAAPRPLTHHSYGLRIRGRWIRYFDEAYLSAKFGHAFKALGRHDQTERFARRSLRMNPSYVRGRSFNLALLATALLGRGAVDEAATVATEADSLAASLRSARATGYVKELRVGLAPYRAASPAVRAFLEPGPST